MPCAFTHDIFDMIAMIAEVRTACWSSDQDAARRLETLPASLQQPTLCLKTSRLSRASGVVGGALLCSPDTTDRLADLRVPPLGEWNSPTRVSSQVSGGGSSRPCRPCRHRLAPIEALSIPHRQPGAGSRTCQAHGVRSNLRHVPSDEGARDLGKTRFNEVFGRARDRGSPDRERGLTITLLAFST